MGKIEIAVELTKSINLICQRAKSEFSSSINRIFQSQSKSSPIPEPPCKRFAVSSSKETKSNISTKDLEFSEPGKNLKIFQIDSPIKKSKLLKSSPTSSNQSSEELIYDPSKTFNPVKSVVSQKPIKNEESIELNEISSSDIMKDLVFSANLVKICSIIEFEQVIQYHKSHLASKYRLEEISNFISRYWKMGFKERKSMRSILERIEMVKVDAEDKQGKAVFNEIQGKVRKVCIR